MPWINESSLARRSACALGAARAGRALGDLGLEAFPGAQVGQCDRGLRRQQRQHIAVGGAEPPGHAVDIGIEIAEQLARRDQRSDQARALVGRRDSFGPMAQARRTRPARGLEPWRHGLQQDLFILAARHARARQHEARRLFQHEQHPCGTRELAGSVGQERVQLRRAAQRVHAQADVEQALQRWRLSAHGWPSRAAAPRPARRRESA
jgi:hypothetical protein